MYIDGPSLLHNLMQFGTDPLGSDDPSREQSRRDASGRLSHGQMIKQENRGTEQEGQRRYSLTHTYP